MQIIIISWIHSYGLFFFITLARSFYNLLYNIVTGKLSFEFTKILNPNEVAPTLVATDISHIGVIDGDGIRKLTIREGLRLFGYPENYNLSMFKNKELSKAFDLLGNTVAIPVVKSVASKLCEVYCQYLS